MTVHRRWAGGVALAALIAAVAPVLAQNISYTAELDPVAHDNSTRANVVGEGTVEARLSGRELTVSGSFSGLSSPATGAHLALGLATGVPGPAIATLSAPSATSGTISGQVSLSPAQVAGLKAGGLYIQLDSTKAPNGNLWGWFLLPSEDR